MVELRQLLSPEMVNGFAKIQEQMTPFLHSIETFRSKLIPFVESIKPALEGVQAFVTKPEVRYWVSITRCETLIHPIYPELLNSDFNISDIEENMFRLKEKLLTRLPDNLKNDNREERYRQILECQMAGLYIPVCRSIYPEIEALLRDEILLSNSDWRKEWESQKDGKSRQFFQSKQFNQLVKNELSGFEFVDEEMSLADVGIVTALFLQTLKDAFEAFDPPHISDSEKKSFRHLHSHGWTKQAMFIDGINGLLTFDLALQLVSKIKERNAKVFNNDKK